jgi:mRNA interferase MazF
MLVQRGEIYWVEFSPVKGNEPGGLRPALVVQNDIGNRFGPTTVVVAITRTIPPQPYPFIVVVEPHESGLPVRSAINCTQMATIQQTGKDSRFRPARGASSLQPIGRLSESKLTEVDKALLFNLLDF